MNAVPMYEAKNKLPLFMHQAETIGPVFISRRNKTVGVILSIEEYNKLIAAKQKPTILEAAADFHKKVNDTLSDEEIDRIFNTRDEDFDTYESHVFDGVFD